MVTSSSVFSGTHLQGLLGVPLWEWDAGSRCQSVPSVAAQRPLSLTPTMASCQTAHETGSHRACPRLPANLGILFWAFVASDLKSLFFCSVVCSLFLFICKTDLSVCVCSVCLCVHVYCNKDMVTCVCCFLQMSCPFTLWSFLMNTAS